MIENRVIFAWSFGTRLTLAQITAQLNVGTKL